MADWNDRIVAAGNLVGYNGLNVVGIYIISLMCTDETPVQQLSLTRDLVFGFHFPREYLICRMDGEFTAVKFGVNNVVIWNGDQISLIFHILEMRLTVFAL